MLESASQSTVMTRHTYVLELSLLDVLWLTLLLQFGNNYILDNYVAVQASSLLLFIFQLAELSPTSPNYLRSTHHHPSCPTSRYFALAAIGTHGVGVRGFLGTDGFESIVAIVDLGFIQE